MGVLDNFIDSAMKQRDYKINLKMAIQNYQDKQRDYEQDQVDRARVLAKTKFDYFGSLLADPNKRRVMDDPTVAELMQGYQQAAEEGNALGLPFKAIDPDPLAKEMAMTIAKFQSDPDYTKLPPLLRYRFIKSNYPKQWGKIKADFINVEVLRNADQPQVLNQAEIDAAGKANQDTATTQLVKGQGPIAGDFQAVPQPVMSTPKSAEELEAEQIFGLFHDADTRTRPQQIDRLGLDVANLAISYDAMTDDMKDFTVKDILSRSTQLGAGITPSSIQTAIQAVRVNRQPKPLTADQSIDNMRQEEKYLTDLIKSRSATAKSDIKALELTRGDRERLFNLRVKMGYEKAGPLPENYGFVSPTTLQQDRTFEMRAEQVLLNLGLARDRVDIALEQLGLAKDKFEWQQQNPSGGAKTNPYQLSKEEIKEAGQRGFTTTAMGSGYQRIRQLLGAKDDPESAFWEDVTGSDGKTKRVLSKEGIKRRDEINTTEEAATKNRRGNGASFGDKSPFVDSHGNKYGPDDCYVYVRNQLNGRGVKASNLRELPKASGSVRAGDVLMLDPRGGYKKPHWVIVNDDGETVSEFQSKKNANGQSQALGIRHDRTVSSLGSRIRQVYRPGGAKVTVRPEGAPAAPKQTGNPRKIVKAGAGASSLLGDLNSNFGKPGAK
jgi:hypothetical protein